MLTLPLFVPKTEVFSPKFCTFGQKFSDGKIFRDFSESQKFWGRNYFSPSCHNATTRGMGGGKFTDRRRSGMRPADSSWSPRDSELSERHHRTTSWAPWRCSYVARYTVDPWCPWRHCRSRRSRSRVWHSDRRSSVHSEPMWSPRPTTSCNWPEIPRSDRILHSTRKQTTHKYYTLVALIINQSINLEFFLKWPK